MSVDAVPLPPISEGLQRVIDEPWRRSRTGVRVERRVPVIVTAQEFEQMARSDNA